MRIDVEFARRRGFLALPLTPRARLVSYAPAHAVCNVATLALLRLSHIDKKVPVAVTFPPNAAKQNANICGLGFWIIIIRCVGAEFDVAYFLSRRSYEKFAPPMPAYRQLFSL